MVSCSFVYWLAPKLWWSIGRTYCSHYSTRVDLYSHQILFKVMYILTPILMTLASSYDSASYRILKSMRENVMPSLDDWNPSKTKIESQMGNLFAGLLSASSGVSRLNCLWNAVWRWLDPQTVSQSHCTALTAGICLPLGLYKETVGGLCKMVEIGHVSPQCIAT